MFGLRAEHDVQAHIEVQIVHWPLEVGPADATGEEDGPGMIGKIFIASLHHFRLAGVGGVMEGKEDIVCEHCIRHVNLRRDDWDGGDRLKLPRRWANIH